MFGKAILTLSLVVLGSDPADDSTELVQQPVVQLASAPYYQGETQPEAAVQPPAPTIVSEGDASEVEIVGEMGMVGEPLMAESCVVDDCHSCGHCGQCTWKHWWFSPCNMPQHTPYFPVKHGYYYFRPYHPAHTRQQSDFVASYGGDPRNPYSNDIFKKVYAELRAEQGELLPITEPAQELPALEPVPPMEPANENSDEQPESINGADDLGQRLGPVFRQIR